MFAAHQSVSVFGMILSAENALQAFEAERRLEENAIRKDARLDLARRGIVPTESEITKWRTSKENAPVSVPTV